MTAATQSVQSELALVFTQDLRIDVPAPDTDLLATGRLDSVRMVELLLQLEKRFDLRVPIEDMEIDHFRSLAAIAEFIAVRRGNGGP